jgi:hypothetical protein
VSTPGLLGHPVRLFRVAHKETSGPPKPALSQTEGFPDYPLEYMPRSSTPAVSSALALSHLGLLPSTPMTVSAFPPEKKSWRLSNVHNYTNFEALSRGLHPRLPWLRTSVTGLTRKVRYQPAGYTLAWWDFHPLGSFDEFL